MRKRSQNNRSIYLRITLEFQLEHTRGSGREGCVVVVVVVMVRRLGSKLRSSPPLICGSGQCWNFSVVSDCSSEVNTPDTGPLSICFSLSLFLLFTTNLELRPAEPLFLASSRSSSSNPTAHLGLVCLGMSLLLH